ncbi:hypothetical protein ACRPOS_007225 [Bartonella heixiaziensis]|uniref:hypothetical protein n=1 Tax=Bartonella heixiaziensis TaxID=1461000 RepID=UPI0039089A04
MWGFCGERDEGDGGGAWGGRLSMRLALCGVENTTQSKRKNGKDSGGVWIVWLSVKWSLVVER